MARTRTQIKTLVEDHTGRTEDTLENSLCDSALKTALMRHPFRDASSVASDVVITTSATTVDISGINNLLDIVTARIVEASGTRNAPFILKNRTWWDRNVINPEDNLQGWPVYGLKVGTTVHLDKPSDAGLELRLRVTTEQTFASDATTCPIAVLDLFVEYFVTAGVFENLTNLELATHWRKRALGPNWDRLGEIGGELLNAINSDKYQVAEDFKIQRSLDVINTQGVSFLNNIPDHARFGLTDWWF